VFFFGGWLVSLLWSGSRKEEVRCVECDTVFQRSTRASKIAWVLLILVVVLILLGLWAELSGSQPGGGE
jgi:predicted nucleic acid-binding Zn ribbon protein